MSTGKRILNEKRLSQQTTQSNPIKVKVETDTIQLTISKEYLKNNSNFDIYNTIMLATSPLFTNENKFVPNTIDKFSLNKLEKPKNSTLFPHIAFFIENKNHYTGGRYSLWHQAVLLSSITKVTIITNLIPRFRDDFRMYETDLFNIVIDNNYELNNYKNNYDVVIGTPLISGEYAARYAKKFDLPLYLQLFESPNWIKQFRNDSPDATEDFWAGYKECLKQANVIMVPSFESMKWLQQWDDDFKNKKIEVVYPCINQWVADCVLANKSEKNLDKINLVMSSRMTNFKLPLAIIKKLPKDIYRFHLIGKVWSTTQESIDALIEKGYDIIVHGIVDDTEKFNIIRNCDILIHPSLFEGFGMPPMEALYFNKHVVAYDLPVLREIYGDNINYAKYNDPIDFADKVRSVKHDSIKIVDGKIKDTLTIHENLGRLLDILNIPKITAGMIVYNGEDYMDYAISSVYKHIYQLIIVEGAVKKYSNEPNSTDKTLEIIMKHKINDKVGKVTAVIADKLWNDKIEMQNVIAKNIKGNIYLKLDHDEIWNIETLKDAVMEFYNDNKLTVLRMPYYHFWLNFQTIAKDAGGKWSTCHPRLWRWNPDFHHTVSFNHFRDANNIPVSDPAYKVKDFQGGKIYHFGYVRELKTLQNKIHYYSIRGIEKFVVDTVTPYSDGKPTQPTQRVDSWAEPFNEILPEIIKEHKYCNCKDIRGFNNE
jgi:glycosyltransferase involved in cell wall biosynthesis